MATEGFFPQVIFDDNMKGFWSKDVITPNFLSKHVGDQVDVRSLPRKTFKTIGIQQTIVLDCIENPDIPKYLFVESKRAKRFFTICFGSDCEYGLHIYTIRDKDILNDIYFKNTFVYCDDVKRWDLYAFLEHKAKKEGAKRFLSVFTL